MKMEHAQRNCEPESPIRVRTALKAGAVAAESDQLANVRGFKLEITNAGGAEVDTAWESVHGGELTLP